MYTEEEIEKFRQAGKLTAEVREYAKTLMKPGESLLKVTELIEKKIEEVGGKPAFPVTMGVNDIAAHYAADVEDDYIFKEDDVVKVDLGVHVDGYAGDTAFTVDFSGKYDELLKCTNEALHAAINKVKAGATLSELGSAIQTTVESAGFRPIKNLSGHGIKRYDLHTGPSIPNYDTGSKETLKANTIIAIEPFATDGRGMIKDSDASTTIFEQVKEGNVRSMLSRKVLADIKEYNGLPFNYRWLTKKHSVGTVRFALRELMQRGILHDHSPLPEVDGGIVAQFEHTILIKEDGYEILTE